MNMTKLGSGESKLEMAISYLFIIGVIISLVLEIVGIILFYHSYGKLSISQDRAVFIQGRDFFSFLYNQLKGGRTEGAAIRFMTAGVVVLLLTPYVRVILSAIYFARERNVKYVLITLFVLTVLTISLIFH